MNNNSDAYEIFQDIFTTEDLYSFYKEIDQFNTLLFQANTEISTAFDEVFNTQRKSALLTYLQIKQIDIHNPSHIQHAMQELKKTGPTFPVVTLKLGYDPTRKHLETFSAWFFTHFETKVILEILVERNLLGGAYITFKGLFKDHSLKSKLQAQDLSIKKTTKEEAGTTKEQNSHE